jgi:serine/threonine protein kinase
LCAGLDASLGEPFVQARLALLGKTVFLLSSMFYAVGNGVLLLTTRIPPAAILLHRASCFHLAATGVMGALWALARLSLGCVAYWLVDGTLVFEGTSGMKIMFAHAHTPPPPPSARVELPIPAALEALILECLEKDPAKRPASAAALQTRLHALAFATPWTAVRAERWWSVHAPASSSESRPVADILLSQEARPLRVVRRARS